MLKDFWLDFGAYLTRRCKLKQPERKLAVAVIVQAFKDLHEGRITEDRECNKMVAKTHKFFTDGGFEVYCRIIGIRPSEVEDAFCAGYMNHPQKAA